MGRVSTAFRAFFAALFNDEMANRVQRALSKEDWQPLEPPNSVALENVKKEPPKPISQKSKPSDAIGLLATLQREARLVDFLKENLGEYSDEQVGAAVREIHRESGAVLDRLFEIRPILGDNEGASIEVPAGFDAAKYRITGKLAGNAPFRGVLRHHGWEASKCELPEFVGETSSMKTIAPAEVEVQ